MSGSTILETFQSSGSLTTSLLKQTVWSCYVGTFVGQRLLPAPN